MQAEWLAPLRQKSLKDFERAGLPSARSEAWRYTALSGLTRGILAPASQKPSEPSSEESQELKKAGGYFGSLRQALETKPQQIPEAVWNQIRMLLESEQLGEGAQEGLKDGFKSLNSAYWADGVLAWVPPNVKLSQPLFIQNASASSSSAYRRNLLILGERAEAQVLEQIADEKESPSEAFLRSTVTQIALDRESQLHHCALVEGQSGNYFLHDMRVTQKRSSRFDAHWVAVGTNWVRQELRCILEEPEAYCNLQGFYAARSSEQRDHHTIVDHRAPHCESRQLYHGVLDDRAHGSFLGHVHVRPDAQKTEARQLNKNLLLSASARADVRPQLQILADDVKCSHGATVGRLDPQALFYLRSRGVGLREATTILVEAFARGMMESILHAEIRARAMQAFADWTLGVSQP